MDKIVSEIMRTNPGSVLSGYPVTFDIQSQYSPEITCVLQKGEIIFGKPGVYSVEWWVATETAPYDTIEFALEFSWNGNVKYIPSCSPIKTGQISGFGVINVEAAESKLSLINAKGARAVFADNTGAKAYMLIMRLEPEYPSGLVGVYHANLSAPASFREVTIGNVIYRIQYAAANTLAMLVKSTAETVTVDIKKSSQVNSANSGSSLDNYPLTVTAQNMQSSILTASNEMHRTWIRQKDPDSGLWSLHEVELFASDNGARVSICVYLVYENIDLSDL